MEKKKLLQKLIQTNMLPIAFIGDSVHTLFVCEYVLSTENGKMTNYHSDASKFCRASSQSKALEKLLPLLTDDEKEIVRRARNAKPKHQAKNASTSDYNHATAFEALIGYLYLSEQKDRLSKFLSLSVEQKEE